jgi:hypothetical protein
MSEPSTLSIYRGNPFVEFTKINPFSHYPNTEEAARSLCSEPISKYYIPKIEDLLQIAENGKIHIFKAMIHMRLFDLHAISFNKETLVSYLRRKGDSAAPYIEILIEEGIDLESLAPLSFWKSCSESSLNARIDVCAERVIEAKKIEHFCLHLLKNQNLTQDVLITLKGAISPHLPYINLERILNTALYQEKTEFQHFLLSLGAKTLRCRDIIYYIRHNASKNKQSETVLKAVTETTCPAVHLPSDSSGATEIFSPKTTENLESALYHGTREHMFRSELSAVFGLDNWTATFDKFSRPDSLLYYQSTVNFFNAIRFAGGIPDNATILTPDDIPLSPEKFWEITSDPTLPLILLSGWEEQASIVILIGDKIYRGNRAPYEADPGVYVGTFDRAKLSIKSIRNIIRNKSPTWFEKDLPLSLGAHFTTNHKLKKQEQHNCTWTSCAELSSFIFSLDEGLDLLEAWNKTKAIRAKVRLSLLQSYLTYNRITTPHLHSPPLLGKILAKCYLKIRSDNQREYIDSARIILKSKLSIDMMELMCTLSKGIINDEKLNENLEEALLDLKNLGDFKDLEELFRLDPEFHFDEKRYRKTLEQLRKPDILFSHFFDIIDPISFINLKSVPIWYKLSVLRELLSPVKALTTLSELPFEKSCPYRPALIENLKSAGLEKPEKHLSTFADTLKKIDLKKTKELHRFLRKLLSTENDLFSHPHLEEKIIDIHEFIVFLLKDPWVGFVLPLHLLGRPETLARISKDVPIVNLFPSLFIRKHLFIKNILIFIKQPGFNLITGTTILHQFLKDQSIYEQLPLTYTFFNALDSSDLETSHEILRSLLGILWTENPFVVEKSFILLLTSVTNSQLACSNLFPIFVDFLWSKDSAFMKENVLVNKLDVTLWPCIPRSLVRKHFPIDPDKEEYSLPEDFLEQIFTKDLSKEEKINLENFLSTFRIGKFTKTRRGDH